MPAANDLNAAVCVNGIAAVGGVDGFPPAAMSLEQ